MDPNSYVPTSSYPFNRVEFPSRPKQPFQAISIGVEFPSRPMQPFQASIGVEFPQGL